jgi:hypothetical protein
MHLFNMLRPPGVAAPAPPPPPLPPVDQILVDHHDNWAGQAYPLMERIVHNADIAARIVAHARRARLQEAYDQINGQLRTLLAYQQELRGRYQPNDDRYWAANMQANALGLQIRPLEDRLAGFARVMNEPRNPRWRL